MYLYRKNITLEMLAAQTTLKNAEKLKHYLLAKNLLNPNYAPIKEFGLIYFPLVKKARIAKVNVVDTKFSFPAKFRQKTIQELLKNKLTSNQISIIPRSQEIVGKIMILEVPDSLVNKEKLIAESYLKLNPNLDTVVRKDRMHTGVYRTRKVKVLAGKRSKETIHLENGVKIKLHLEKTYFSARSGNERLRIAKLVKPGEEVLVMFSGAAPFPLVIAKNSLAKSVLGIELNPLAHQFALQNVELNKLPVRILHGDVNKIVPKLRKKYDRIVMPLPKTGEQFLPIALKKVKSTGVIHLYAFLNENDLKKEAMRIRKEFSVKILRIVKCGQFSPGTFRICFDLKKINKK